MSDLVPLPEKAPEVPWPTADWPRGALAAGVDRPALDGLLEHAFAQPEELGRTNALLVVQHGRIVVERYADDVDEPTTHISWSMAKSILHAAVGLLVREGRLDVTSRAGVPEWSDPADPRHPITLDQLLAMRSGLTFVEDYVDQGVSHVIDMLFGGGRDDVAGYAAALPLAHPPGSVFSYSSGSSNIVSRIVADVVGRGSACEAFLRRELFDVLGMRSATLRIDDAGTWVASSFVFASARDFARFGLLYLRDGVWEGRRVLPAGWVDYARTQVSPAETEPHGYGSHFWIVPGSLGIFQAQGYNGQRTTIVPGLDLVLVRLGVTPAPLAPNLEVFMKRLIDAFRPTRA